MQSYLQTRDEKEFLSLSLQRKVTPGRVVFLDTYTLVKVSTGSRRFSEILFVVSSPGFDKVEGENIKAVYCHHLYGDHENNPLDGMNWIPLCRRHHMLADGRLKTASAKEIDKARQAAFKAHRDYMKKNYIGEVKTYHE